MASAKETTLKLVVDHDAESPREWDNLGVMVCTHRRYKLGDEGGKEKALELIYKHLSEAQLERDGFDDTSLPEIQAALEKTGQAILLPVYMYEHSGIAINTTGFSCRWDSGQLGFIFVSKEDVRQEFGWKLVTASRKDRIIKILNAEVETYDQYLSGDVWGYKVEKDGEVIDSCWGFFGSDPMTNGMTDYLDDTLKQKVSSGSYERIYS